MDSTQALGSRSPLKESTSEHGVFVEAYDYGVENDVLWTDESADRCVRYLVTHQELTKLGYSASSRLVAILLHGLGYSLQGNRKTIEGKQHPDRNARFEYINARVTAQMRAAQPVIKWWLAQGRRAYPKPE